jgi:hypothetical protein
MPVITVDGDRARDTDNVPLFGDFEAPEIPPWKWIQEMIRICKAERNGNSASCVLCRGRSPGLPSSRSGHKGMPSFTKRATERRVRMNRQFMEIDAGRIAYVGGGKGPGLILMHSLSCLSRL